MQPGIAYRSIDGQVYAPDRMRIATQRRCEREARVNAGVKVRVYMRFHDCHLMALVERQRPLLCAYTGVYAGRNLRL